MIRAPCNPAELQADYQEKPRARCMYEANGQVVCNNHNLLRAKHGREGFTSLTTVTIASITAQTLLATSGIINAAANAAAEADAEAATADAAAKDEADAYAADKADADAKAKAEAQPKQGLVWSRYDQGYFGDNPGWFDGKTATATGTTNGWFDINQTLGNMNAGYLPISQTNLFSFLISGIFVPQTTGSHQFRLSSDDASYLWVGPVAAGVVSNLKTSDAVISLAGIHGNNGSNASVDMIAGTSYPLVIMYGQNYGGWNLQFSFTPPGGSTTTDGSKFFFFQKTSQS